MLPIGAGGRDPELNAEDVLIRIMDDFATIHAHTGYTAGSPPAHVTRP